MSTPGWYPDPAGTPQTYRYWDGRAWSASTTQNPADPAPGSGLRPAVAHRPEPAATMFPPASAPAPASQPPLQPASSQPHPWASYDASGGAGGGTGRSGRRVGVTIGIVAAVVLLVAGLGVGAFVAVSKVTGGDADEQSSATGQGRDESGDGTPADDRSERAEADCKSGDPVASDSQADADRISAGGISMPRVRGYEVELEQAKPFKFADDFVPQVRVIESAASGGWVSVYGVGGVSTGHGTPEQAADAVMQCMADSSDLYSHFTERKDLRNEAVEIPGAVSAWRLESELHVDNPRLEVTGDHAVVIVVDTGDEDTFGLYVSVVPLGAKKLAAQQARVSGQLQVD